MKTVRICAIYGLLLTQSIAVQAADPEAGKQRAAACGGCHGATGIAPAPNFPNLAGQKSAYLAKALADYKSGARPDPTMKAMASGLSDEEIENIAAYYSSLPGKNVALTPAATPTADKAEK